MYALDEDALRGTDTFCHLVLVVCSVNFLIEFQNLAKKLMFLQTDTERALCGLYKNFFAH